MHFSRGASQFQLTVGEHNLTDGSSTEMKKINVKEIIMHPSYISSEKKDDIALIKVDGHIEWSDFVQPICLPNSADSTFSGRIATVSGWGWSDEALNGKY